MKRLTTYLNERLIINQRFDEKLIINKNYNLYTCAPKSFKELRKIIEQRYKEQGPGTEKNPIDFNDVDVSNIDSFYDGTVGIFDVTKFEYIDISDWDVSNVEHMEYMFYHCENLESAGDLSNWDVSKVENMRGMFAWCNKLISIGDLSDWDVSKVENMNSMFYDCINLKFVGDLSNWNVSECENMRGMFAHSGIKNTPYWYKE